MNDSYIFVITALLPLAAAILIFEVNPYHALVIRGVLGAVAALVYTVLGAADVALTEALVGTLLAIALYAVAVRSSLVVRLGVLQEDLNRSADDLDSMTLPTVVNAMKRVFKDFYVRVELIPYLNREELFQALMDKEIHATCERKLVAGKGATTPFYTTTRLRRLYDLMNTEVLASLTELTYWDPRVGGEGQ